MARISLRGYTSIGYMFITTITTFPNHGCRWCLLLCIAVTGCHSTPVTPAEPTTQWIADAVGSGLTSPVADDSLKAITCAPVGWKPDAVKVSPNHRHQIWLSKTGDTAYGIIYFKMPLPVGTSMVIGPFINEMKKTEGDATLLSRTDDDKLPGIRFVAEGGLYRIRCNMMVDGFHGWAVYAGTLRSRPVNAVELELAEKAREQTRVNLP